jgi:TonB family protein
MQRFLVCWLAVALFTSPLMAWAARERAAYAPLPQYPADAKARHLTGSGAFALHIRPDGSVERVETVKNIGHPTLDRAAIAAFERWRFHPDSATWVLRIPIRYVDGPKRLDPSMSRAPSPGWGVLVTVFSRHD